MKMVHMAVTAIKASASLFAFSKKINYALLLKSFRFGSDRFLIKVKASGYSYKDQATYEHWVDGYGERNIAGLVATEVAKRLYLSSFESGMFHIDQLFEPVDFIKELFKIDHTLRCSINMSE